MKAKYLFYSLALASAFTACTQDELFDAPDWKATMQLVVRLQVL